MRLLAIQKFLLHFFEHSSVEFFFFQNISIIFTFSLFLNLRTGVHIFVVLWIHDSIAWSHEKEA